MNQITEGNYSLRWFMYCRPNYSFTFDFKSKVQIKSMRIDSLLNEMRPWDMINTSYTLEYSNDMTEFIPLYTEWYKTRQEKIWHFPNLTEKIQYFRFRSLDYVNNSIWHGFYISSVEFFSENIDAPSCKINRNLIGKFDILKLYSFILIYT